jgi:hypothetical protein
MGAFRRAGTFTDIDEAPISLPSYRSFLYRLEKRRLPEDARKRARKRAGRGVVNNACSA